MKVAIVNGFKTQNVYSQKNQNVSFGTISPALLNAIEKRANDIPVEEIVEFGKTLAFLKRHPIQFDYFETFLQHKGSKDDIISKIVIATPPSVKKEEKLKFWTLAGPTQNNLNMPYIIEKAKKLTNEYDVIKQTPSTQKEINTANSQIKEYNEQIAEIKLINLKKAINNENVSTEGIKEMVNPAQKQIEIINDKIKLLSPNSDKSLKEKMEKLFPCIYVPRGKSNGNLIGLRPEVPVT